MTDTVECAACNAQISLVYIVPPDKPPKVLALAGYDDEGQLGWFFCDFDCLQDWLRKRDEHLR